MIDILLHFAKFRCSTAVSQLVDTSYTAGIAIPIKIRKILHSDMALCHLIVRVFSSITGKLLFLASAALATLSRIALVFLGMEVHFTAAFQTLKIRYIGQILPILCTGVWEFFPTYVQMIARVAYWWHESHDLQIQDSHMDSTY